VLQASREQSVQQISSTKLGEKVALSHDIKDIDRVLEKLLFEPGAMKILLAQQLQNVALLWMKTVWETS
jgi:hypothetical protein